MERQVSMIPRENNRSLNIACSPSFLSEPDVLLACNDVLEFLRTVPDESINLVVSSPPYNIGKVYERRTGLGEYLKWQARVLRECKRVLRPDGSLCWQVGNYIESGEVFPLDAYFYRILKTKLGFKLRNRIIWYFEHGLHASRRFSGRYEVVLWFTKTDHYIFNLDAVRVPQKYPGKRHYKGPHVGEFSGNPLGKNPSDIWLLLEEEWDSGIWDIPNVKWNHPEKTEHPAQYPIELIERLVLALTDQGQLVLDPFCGVGSALVASVIHDRRAVGVDNSPEYINVAHRRLEAFLDGSLKRRTLGTRKYAPNGREKISQRPLDWPKS